jgi:hypothetical protein
MTKKKIINTRVRERREKRARIGSAIYTATEEAGLKHAYTLETADSDNIGGVCV